MADYFRKRLTEALQKRGLSVTDQPAKGVARFPVAITGVTSSTWCLRVHPASRAMGAGAGGAAMEGEVLDSVSGKQLAAVVQASAGNFNITAFRTVDDVKSALDQWAELAGQRLYELSAAK